MQLRSMFKMRMSILNTATTEQMGYDLSLIHIYGCHHLYFRASVHPDSSQSCSDFLNKSGNLPNCMSAWLEVWNNKLSDLSSYWYCRTPCFLQF